MYRWRGSMRKLGSRLSEDFNMCSRNISSSMSSLMESQRASWAGMRAWAAPEVASGCSSPGGGLGARGYLTTRWNWSASRSSAVSWSGELVRWLSRLPSGSCWLSSNFVVEGLESPCWRVLWIVDSVEEGHPVIGSRSADDRTSAGALGTLS